MTLQNLLLVDDEADIRAVARLALGTVGGLQVDDCADGRQALERAALQQPQLILLDVMMPGMTGPDTLKALRDDPATQAIPIIFMTAKAQRHEIDELLALGALGVITKPFDPMTLAQQVRQLWSQRG